MAAIELAELNSRSCRRRSVKLLEGRWKLEFVPSCVRAESLPYLSYRLNSLKGVI